MEESRPRTRGRPRGRGRGRPRTRASDGSNLSSRAKSIPSGFYGDKTIPAKDMVLRDLIVNQDDRAASYQVKADKVSIPWGQRKLALALIQFLTRHWDPAAVPKPKLIYIGSAPGVGIDYTRHLFPQFEYWLYDPRPTNVKGPNVHVIQDFFTDETAEEWADRDDVFIISDIRRDINAVDDSEDELEEKVVADMRLQEGWYDTIRPVAAHLKFRLPYTGGRYTHFKYPEGIIYKRVWGPRATTEGGFVPTSYRKIDWDVKVYEEQMFYHNVYVRGRQRYNNPFTGKVEPVGEELLNDYDSMGEVLIFMDYLKKAGVDPTRENVLSLVRGLQRHIQGRGTGAITLNDLRRDPLIIKRTYMPGLRYEEPDD